MLIGTTSATFAQTESDSDQQRADRYQLEIDRISAEHGPFDPQLAELLAEQGQSLNHDGNYPAAVEVLKRSLHLYRINHGLHSHQQELVLRSLIDNLSLLGAHEEVGHYHLQLTRLHNWLRTNNASVDLVPMLLESSAWHRDLYLDLSASITVPHLRKSTRLARLAQRILSDHHDPDHVSLIDPLMSIAENSYYLTRYYQQEARYYGARGEALSSRMVSDSFEQGLESYRKIVAIHQNNQSPPQDLAKAQIALGDYLQLFRQHDQSRDAYISAWNTLDKAGDTDSIEKLLGNPVKLPNFDHNNNLGAKAVARVKAEIDKNGRVRNVEVLETWPADNRLVVQSAQRVAMRSIFRNQIVAGEVSSGTVEFNLLLSH